MKNLLKALLLVLDEALLVAIVLVVLWQMGVHLSPWIITTVVVLLAVLVFILYRVIVSLTKREQVGGREGLIGLQGKVVRPLTPEGVIKTRGELWKAKCIDDSISTQEEVVVIGVEGLKLLVKRKKDV